MSENDKITIIGVPLDLGAENLGVEGGPSALKKQGIVTKLQTAGFDVSMVDDIRVMPRDSLKPGNPKLNYLDEIVRVNEELAKLVEEQIKNNSRVVVLGGDHSINLGAVSGASVALGSNLGLIYFDAHGDMNTNETTLTGNIHGMHLASLMGFGAKELSQVHGPGTKLDKHNLLHIGGSDFDQSELDLANKENLKLFTLFDLLTKSLGPLIEEIDNMANRLANIWVSLDLDSIDRTYAPAAAMPNAKGLLYREIALITEYIGKHCNVVGVDLVEYNPLADEEHKTAELGIELIAKLLGKNYSWYTNYLARNKV
ncbi:MAG: arginase [Candidatus Saccharimonadales bacterium]